MAVATACSVEFSLRSCAALHEGAIPELHKNQVHVWWLPLHESHPAIPQLRELLSPDELDRAARFRFPRHNAQFVLTRGTLRRLLASYAGISPQAIWFQYSEHEKPKAAGTDIEFNVSHTDGMAILGFTRGRRLGLDIEKLRTDFQTSEIAERFFSAAERAALRELPLDRRYLPFFRIWTRKEAYIKALGEGLSHPLHQFDVSLGDVAELLATRPDPAERVRWQLQNLNIALEFAAAAAVEREGKT